jgi:addiction module HigA family antidote
MHPGEMLREDVLPSLGKSKSEIASLLGVSRHTLYDVLNEERPVTPNLALRLARLVGGSPETWLRLQDAYDLVQMQEAISRELSAIPRLEPVE